MSLAGIGLLVAGLSQPHHPLPSIRTSLGQTPIARPMHIPATSTHIPPTAMVFQPVSTPKSTFYVGVQSYALLSHCGVYEPTLPDQRMPTNRIVAMQPVPECRVE